LTTVSHKRFIYFLITERYDMSTGGYMVKKSTNYSSAWYALAGARILLGFVFLWAFIDKAFGLGLATKASNAWLSGGSPTSGFLKMGVNPDSPFAEFFHGLAGSPVVDYLFMLGLLGIGVALLLGVGLRIAAATGTVLLLMMWAASLPLENNPLVDDHIVYIAVLWAVAAGRREVSLASWWTSQEAVKKNKWLW
jgi:thiosulfate dehydrogenase [quinone] large subunit